MLSEPQFAVSRWQAVTSRRPARPLSQAMPGLPASGWLVSGPGPARDLARQPRGGSTVLRPCMRSRVLKYGLLLPACSAATKYSPSTSLWLVQTHPRGPNSRLDVQLLGVLPSSSLMFQRCQLLGVLPSPSSSFPRSEVGGMANRLCAAFTGVLHFASWLVWHGNRHTPRQHALLIISGVGSTAILTWWLVLVRPRVMAQRAADKELEAAQVALQAKRWPAAEQAAMRAKAHLVGVAGLEAGVAKASELAQRARIGAADEELEAAQVALRAKRWSAAEQAAMRAKAHLVGVAGLEAGVAKASELAQRARIGAADEELEAAQVALRAKRWSAAEQAAMRAKAHLVGVAGLEAGVAKASELAQRARIGAADERRRQMESDAAEPGYVECLDFFIRNRKDFTGHDPTAYRVKLSVVSVNCAPPRELLGSLEMFIHRNRGHFTYHAGSGGSVSVTTLTPFRGQKSHRVFGEFRCSAVRKGGRPCNKRWKSAATYCDCYQQCRQCEARIYPFAQHVLERKEAAADDDAPAHPHDTDRCQRCQNLGYNCMPHSIATGVYATPYDDDTWGYDDRY